MKSDADTERDVLIESGAVGDSVLEEVVETLFDADAAAVPDRDSDGVACDSLVDTLGLGWLWLPVG